MYRRALHRPQAAGRFYSLDALRGIAALTVIFWHWQHFFAPLNPLGAALQQSRQPFFSTLSFLYRHGYTAVWLFFCLSGFVFFWLYAARIASGAIALRHFAILRLSRLYPLHLATLLLVAIGQLAYRAITQQQFVYQANDPYHFVLNLLFVSSWGLERGYAFNAPIWSVSVEIFLYGIFFLACRQFKPGWASICAGIGAGCILQQYIGPLGIGMLFFFLGGLAYRIFDAIARTVNDRFLHWLVPGATGLLWGMAILAADPVQQRAAPRFLQWFGPDIFSACTLALFPLTVLALALIETRRGTLGRRLAFLGDLSYSSYLLHFPLQLGIALILAAWKLDPQVAFSRAFMLLFFAALLPLSFASHKLFEMPVQRWLRKRYITDHTPAPPAAPAPGRIIDLPTSQFPARWSSETTNASLNIQQENVAAATAAQPTAAPHSLHPKYRADIDGLRAVAVLSVVLFHAFPQALRGGFIGVDIFFVISGFLISTIIVGNLENHTFSFADFYGRRVRRIFPVLLLVLASTFAAGWFLMLAGEFKQLGLHVASGAGFLANFSFWHESGYFDTAAGTKPLLHLWSLGVEEQFYILWPGLLWLAWKKRFNLLSLMIVVGLASLALNINAIHVDPSQAFYSPQTRFWEMVCGSVLAWMTLHRTTAFAAARQRVDGWLVAAIHAGPRPVDGSTLRNVQALLGVGLVALGMVLITEARAFPGWWALLPTTGAVLIIAAGPQAWFNRVVLSHRALVQVGLISFPLYLWHWPLLVFARIVERGTPAPAIRIGAMAAALLLAWLSYVLVEKRLRSGRHNRAKTVVLVALMAAMCAAGYTVHRNGYLPAHMSDREAFSSYFENGLPGWHYFNEVGIPEKVQHDCEFFDIASYRAGHKTMVPRSSIAPHCYQRDPARPHVVVLWGDSHAEHLSYGIRKNLPADWQLLQVASSSCTPYLDVAGPSTTDQCAQSNWFAQKLIAETRPDVVVVAQHLDQTGERIEQIYWKLKSLGVKKIVVTGPVPHWTAPLPTLMLTKFWVDTPRRSFLGVDKDVFAYNARLLKSMKPQDGLVYADLTGFMCNADGCLTYLGDDRKTGITSYDDSHLTPATSDYVGKSFLVGLITGTPKP